MELNQVVNDIEGVLIEKSIQGDESAQKELYYRYAPGMLNVAYRIVKHEEDARDVLQESFMKAFGALAKLKNRKGFAAWMKRIVVNTSISCVNKRKGIRWMELDGKMEDVVDSIDEKIHLDIQEVKKALMELPDGYRTVLTLYLIEGYDHEEISTILNISKSTSLTQYSRGKRKLSALLKNRI